MAGFLSKLFTNPLNFNCYEIGHAWTPNCTEACLDIGLSTLQESFKIYFPLFLIQQLLKKKISIQVLNHILRNTLRSTLFLSFNAYLAMYFFCLFRRIFGKFYYLIICWPPMFFASFFAIYIENIHRRGPLALYTMNIASESIFKALNKRGYLPKIPKFEIILFTLSISVYIYILQRKKLTKDVFSNIFQFILGNFNLAKEKELRITLDPNNELDLNENKNCIHYEHCLLYALNGFIKCFMAGATLKAASRILPKFKKIISNPTFILDEFMSISNLKFGFFLGMFSLMYKSSSCFLRRLNNGKKEWHCIVSSLVAGPFMYLSPNTSLAMFFLWRSLESIYNEYIDHNLINHKHVYTSIAYSLATAQIFYSVIMEPENIKSSYIKFVNQLTDNRINYFNRDIFRYFFKLSDNNLELETIKNSNLIDLNSRYTTDHYRQMISLWEL